MDMAEFTDEMHEWEMDVAVALFRVLVPEGADEPLVAADEVCFMGALPALPEALGYLEGIGTPVAEPEVYIVGIKDGELIAPDVWYGAALRPRLEEAGIEMQQMMRHLGDLYAGAGRSCPTVVKTAVVMDTGQAITIQEFDRLPEPPNRMMTAADWAFDQWVGRIARVGSAFGELNE
jgi:hypothetical protein